MTIMKATQCVWLQTTTAPCHAVAAPERGLHPASSSVPAFETDGTRQAAPIPTSQPSLGFYGMLNENLLHLVASSSLSSAFAVQLSACASRPEARLGSEYPDAVFAMPLQNTSVVISKASRLDEP